MPFKISEFRGKALNNAGARANLFEVVMTAPQAATELNADSGKEFSFACKASAIPTMTVGVVEVPYFGRVVKVPGNKTFDNWNVTIINDEEFHLRNGFEKWVAAMGTHEENVATIGNTFGATGGGNLFGSATVQHYSKGGGKIAAAEYKFVNIFPVSVAEIALGWDANDAIEEFTVEFAYDYWTHVSVVT